MDDVFTMLLFVMSKLFDIIGKVCTVMIIDMYRRKCTSTFFFFLFLAFDVSLEYRDDEIFL